jgi:hypothetical protein
MINQLGKRPSKNFRVMLELLAHPNGTNATVIAKRLGIHMSSTSRSLSLLEDLGFVKSENGRYSDDKKKLLYLKPEFVPWFTFLLNLFKDAPKQTINDKNGFLDNVINFAWRQFPQPNKVYFRTKVEGLKAKQSQLLVFGRSIGPANYGFETFLARYICPKICPKQVNTSAEAQEILEQKTDLIDLNDECSNTLLEPQFKFNQLLKDEKVKVIGSIGTRTYHYLKIEKCEEKKTVDPKPRLFALGTSAQAIHFANEIQKKEKLEISLLSTPDELYEKVDETIEQNQVARIVAQAPISTILLTRKSVSSDIFVKDVETLEDVNLLIAPTKSVRGMENEINLLQQYIGHYLGKLNENYRLKLTEKCANILKPFFRAHFPRSKIPN